MIATTDDLYLEWLYSEVWNVKAKSLSHTYWNFARQLYTTEFVWFVPNDDNRIEDGYELRMEFLRAARLSHISNGWEKLGCSMLELLIGLGRRLAFEADGEVGDWCHELLANIGLQNCPDAGYARNEAAVAAALERIIWRTYDRRGHGGLFPLYGGPYRDQRKVELWYQLSAYLLEKS